MNHADNETLVAATGWQHRVKSVLGKVISKRFESVLDGIVHGQLALTWPDGHTSLHGNKSETAEQNASLVLHNFLPVKRLITDGQIGFAESYMQGEWNTDNLRNLFALIMRNEKQINPATRASGITRLFNSIQHWSRRNSKSGSKRNIAYHYDLGNDFYKLWLDSSMSYSSALFTSADQTLEQAQQNKLQRIIDMLQPAPNSQVLEIGCGWGAMGHKLATDAQCNVTGISLSSEQLDYANIHHGVGGVGQGGVGHPGARFEHIDYRDVSGKYNHVVSIEMFEAVGQQYWNTFFEKLSDLLESGGTAVLQVITLAESRFEEYRSEPDFIQRYIFPGGMLPTRTHLDELVAGHRFELLESQWFGHSYARTLALWRERFEQRIAEVGLLNFDERFVRMWRYYLVYCETGFNLGQTDVGLLHLKRR